MAVERGFNPDESYSKFGVLSYVIPIALHALMGKRFTVIDLCAGPGEFRDARRGRIVDGSPAIFHRILSSIRGSCLHLIDNNREAYRRLVEFADQLPDSSCRVSVKYGDCADYVHRLVDAAGDSQVILFSDPCGCEIPEFLAELGKRENVTIIVRYSLLAGLRHSNTGHLSIMRERLEALNESSLYWNASFETDTHNKWMLMVGTHSRRLSQSIQCVLPLVKEPTAAFDTHLLAVRGTAELSSPAAVEAVRNPNRRGPKSPITDAEMTRMIKLRTEDHLPLPKIAEELGYHTTTVRVHLKQAGISTARILKKDLIVNQDKVDEVMASAPKRDHSRRRRCLSKGQMRNALKAVRGGKSTYGEEAKKLDVSYNTLRRRLAEAELV